MNPSSKQESFEESQRRHTGTSQGSLHRTSSRLRDIRWRRVLLPAAFFAVPFTFILRDFLGGDDMPPLVVAAIYLCVFAAAAALFALRGGASSQRRRTRRLRRR